MAVIEPVSLYDVPDDKLREIIGGILEHLKLTPVACHKHDAIQWYGVAPEEQNP